MCRSLTEPVSLWHSHCREQARYLPVVPISSTRHEQCGESAVEFLRHSRKALVDMSRNPPTIVCESVHHDNTLRIAQAMARVIGADVVAPEQWPTEASATTNLVGLGSGIYFGAHSKKILRLAESLPPGKRRLFIFSTAGLPFLCGFFHRRLRQILGSKGIEVVGEFHCPGWDTFGPAALIGGIYRNHPNEHDVRRAEAFARSLVDEHRLELEGPTPMT